MNNQRDFNKVLSRLMHLASGFSRGSFPAYSGGTVMALHHLPQNIALVSSGLLYIGKLKKSYDNKRLGTIPLKSVRCPARARLCSGKNNFFDLDIMKQVGLQNYLSVQIKGKS